ncbi:ABC transporter substrate-binding protein [Isoptericola sp. b441]|uniref:Probable sugar-binding periplasmic protein n=1 Tax=Actinotalea lenta TaxID=3064654 RepID=A0ABT9D591_9CELL|nr:ABC transporter substrate-binding protein [Isoptericola sp. b441]MDO8105610.1 ABC transporter substrate-binding protein [Isoptericola sp. b441]
MKRHRRQDPPGTLRWRARIRRAGMGRTASALLAVVATAAACSAPAPATTTGRQVEVFTWWASGAEKLAMDVLVQRFRAEHPDVGYVDAAVAGGAGTVAKGVLAARFADGDPPDTFQVHGGAELTAQVSAGHVRPLSSLFDQVGLEDVLPPVVLDSVSVHGVPYAVPVDVHRTNLLWANTDVLAQAGLDPTARYDSLDSWMAALDQVRAAGLTPLAIGSTWTQVHLLEVVLLSRLGPTTYAGLWDGTADATSPEVKAAVEDFARIMQDTNADRDSLDWQDATGRVNEGRAAFVVMGDWAQEVFDPPVVWAPFPGTADVDDITVDAFAAPVGAVHPTGADAWLSTVAGLDTQVAFANAKGAIPARNDALQTSLGDYPRSALRTFRTATVVPSLAHGMAAPPQAVDDITRAVSSLARGTASTAQVVAALAGAAWR